MNALGTLKWRFVVVTLAGTSCIAAVYGTYRWWDSRQSAAATLMGGRIESTSLLPDAEANRIRELVHSMMNPVESTEAAVQLRDHIKSLIQEDAVTAPLSMALYLECMAPKFASLDSQSRQINLALVSDIFGWFGNNPTRSWPALLEPSSTVFSSALADSSLEVAQAALQIIRACWEWSPPDVDTPSQRKSLGTWKAELHARCVELLHSRDPKTRIAAGVTVISVPIQEAATRGLVLLHDESPQVRRALLLALSDRADLLSSEDVLTFLRDPHQSVRATADVVLTSRGLTREQIALATRATDPSPMVRAQTPRQIVESTAIDRVVWLTQLSRDSAAQVRTEAARALAVVGGEEPIARLTEMAATDPDPQVRQIAHDLAESHLPALQSQGAGSAVKTLPTVQSPKAN